MLTQRLFLKFSELQLWEDGVSTISRRRDAVDVAVRESTRRVNVQRQFRDGVRATQVQQVDVLLHFVFTGEAHE